MESFRSRSARRVRSFTVIDVPLPTESIVPFPVVAEKLSQLVITKDPSIPEKLGGVQQLISDLKSSPELGIRGDTADLCHRRNVFGSNTLPKSTFISSCFRVGLRKIRHDVTTLMAAACALYLIIAGIMKNGRGGGWKEGVYALAYAFASPLSDKAIDLCIEIYSKKVKKHRDSVVILRNGQNQLIPSSEVVVGDVVILKTGDKVPAHGILLDVYHPLTFDTSNLTQKEDPAAAVEQVEHASSNPFLSCGAIVLQGQAKMLIIGVGVNRVCFRKRHHWMGTRLEGEVDILDKYLQRATRILAVSFTLIFLSRYFSGNTKYSDGGKQFEPVVTSALQASYDVTEVIFASLLISSAMDTEGFAWAIKVTLGHAFRDFSRHNVIVRNLVAWEKLGIGVAKLVVAEEFHGAGLGSNLICYEDSAIQESGQDLMEPLEDVRSIHDTLVTKFCLVKELEGDGACSAPPAVLELLKQGIGLSTATNPISSNDFLESTIQRAIVCWAIQVLDLHSDANFSFHPQERFNLEDHQGIGFIMSLENGSFHVHEKGSAENLLKMCSSYYCGTGEKRVLGSPERMLLEKLEDENGVWESRKCNWVAFVCAEDENGVCWSLLGILILYQEKMNGDAYPEDEDSISGEEGSPAAAADEDSISGEEGSPAAAAAADEVLIDNEEDARHVDGVSDLISKATSRGRDDVVSPTNNTTTTMIKDEEVGAILEAEQVLVSMGIENWTTTRSPDIVILDGKESTLELISGWSASASHNSQMFLQYQITASITSMIFTFINYATWDSTPEVDMELASLLIQLLCVNSLMGFVAAVSFGREKPQPPSSYAGKQRKQLIDGFMARNIVSQVAYQTIVMSILEASPNLSLSNDEITMITTVTPIFLQVFNMVNSRKIKEKNIFSGMRLRFICLVAVLIVSPVVVVEVLGALTKSVTRLSWMQWGLCIAIGMGTLPVCFAFKFVPVGWVVSPLQVCLSSFRDIKGRGNEVIGYIKSLFSCCDGFCFKWLF